MDSDIKNRFDNIVEVIKLQQSQIDGLQTQIKLLMAGSVEEVKKIVEENNVNVNYNDKF